MTNYHKVLKINRLTNEFLGIVGRDEINISNHDELISNLVGFDKIISDLSTDGANGVIDNQEYETKLNEIEDQIKMISKKFGFNYYIQTDPRGYNLYISKDEITGSNYNKGLCLGVMAGMIN
jgi:hypothetical protein